MGVNLEIRNISGYKSTYRAQELDRLADKICEREGLSGEIELSLLFCMDSDIAEMNKTYCGKAEATDVLSFGQFSAKEIGSNAARKALAGLHKGRELCLGDIVISLETLDRRNTDTTFGMWIETRILFCHGLLHLLGYEHDTPGDQRRMAEVQALYLLMDVKDVWPASHTADASRSGKKTR